MKKHYLPSGLLDYGVSFKSLQDDLPSAQAFKKGQQKYSKKKTGSQAYFLTPRDLEVEEASIGAEGGTRIRKHTFLKLADILGFSFNVSGLKRFWGSFNSHNWFNIFSQNLKKGQQKYNRVCGTRRVKTVAEALVESWKH